MTESMSASRPSPAAWLRRRYLVLGALALVGGVLAGLARFAWDVPAIAASAAGWHAALMIGGFFGTVISLERAVAVERPWAYLAPFAAGIGGLLLLAGAPLVAAQLALILAAVVLFAASAVVLRRQDAVFTRVIAFAASCWLIGNLVWLIADDAQAPLAGWLAFLILTIAGERLELSRFVPTPGYARQFFVGVVALFVAGVAAGSFGLADRHVMFAAGLLALATWLLRWDIARRTIGQGGLARYIAVSLLAGYGWLALAGLLGLGGALEAGHPLRDVALHALTVGFVLSMVFGHAPIIFPAVAKVTLPYSAFFYVPLAALHATLALRVAGGLLGDFALARCGALGNALALVLFVATMLVAAIRGGRRRASRHNSNDNVRNNSRVINAI